MATRANLIETYNSNPTLQSRYTLQQYLDMFGFGTTTTTTPTTTTTTPTQTPVTPGIPNIINQNIDQGGDGPSGPPPGPTDPYAGLGYSSANFGLGKETIGGFVNKDAVMDYEADAYNVGRTLPGQLSKLGLAAFNAFKNLPTPFNLMRKAYDFTKQKEIQRQEQAAAIQAEYERDVARRGRENFSGVYASADRQGFTDGKGGGFGSKSTGTNEAFSNETGRGRTGYDDGGRVYLYNRLK